MTNRVIKAAQIWAYAAWLHQEEKSDATIEKYIRDVRAFSAYIQDQAVHKELVVQYKKYLLEKGYAVRSINSMLANIHKFFSYMGWEDCKVKSIRTQRQIYCPEEKTAYKKRVSPIIISIQE